MAAGDMLEGFQRQFGCLALAVTLSLAELALAALGRQPGIYYTIAGSIQGSASAARAPTVTSTSCSAQGFHILSSRRGPRLVARVGIMSNQVPVLTSQTGCRLLGSPLCCPTAQFNAARRCTRRREAHATRGAAGAAGSSSSSSSGHSRRRGLGPVPGHPVQAVVAAVAGAARQRPRARGASPVAKASDGMTRRHRATTRTRRTRTRSPPSKWTSYLN